jgi:hypothetical protein
VEPEACSELPPGADMGKLDKLLKTPVKVEEHRGTYDIVTDDVLADVLAITFEQEVATKMCNLWNQNLKDMRPPNLEESQDAENDR